MPFCIQTAFVGAAISKSLCLLLPLAQMSSAFPDFDTFSQLFSVIFVGFNSFHFSKTAAAEAPISPISAALLLHDNVFSELLSPPRSAFSR